MKNEPYETHGSDRWWHPLLALLITLLVMFAFVKIVALDNIALGFAFQRVHDPG